MMMIREDSPVPNHNVMRGTNEIGGIGRMISKIGLNIARNVLFQPSPTPKGTPNRIARSIASTILRILIPTCTIIGTLAIVEDQTMSNRSKVANGVGSIVLPLTANICQKITNNMISRVGEI